MKETSQMRSSTWFDSDLLAGEELAQLILRVLKPMRPQVVTMAALSWKG